MTLSAERNQRQQHPCRHFNRHSRQKAAARQENGCCIKPAQQAAEGIASAVQGNSRQSCRRQHQKIIDQSVKQEYAVQIHNSHRHPSRQGNYSLTELENPSQKEGWAEKPVLNRSTSCTYLIYISGNLPFFRPQAALGSQAAYFQPVSCYLKILRRLNFEKQW